MHSSFLLSIFTIVSSAQTKSIDFLILGDWGFKPIIGTLWNKDPQKLVANAMINVTDENTKFVISTGDNFYRGYGYLLAGDGVQGVHDKS